jgi:hypothetical protein
VKPVTRKQFELIVSFLQKNQLATVNQISTATNLPGGTVRMILAYQEFFMCRRPSGQPSVFSLRNPLPITASREPRTQKAGKPRRARASGCCG